MTCLLLVVSSPYIGQRYSNILKLIIEIVIINLLWINYRFDKIVIKNSLFIILYFLALAISTYLYHGIGTRLMNSLVTGGTYIVFFWVCSFFSRKYSKDFVIKLVKNNLIFYMLIADFFVFTSFGKGIGGKSIGGEVIREAVFLIGNKFTIAYLHMLVMALLMKERENNLFQRTIGPIIFLTYSMLICIIADTTTGMVGCLLVALISYMIAYQKRIKKILTNPLVVIVFFLGINGIFLLTDMILNNSELTNILLQRSHTGTILSGRVFMYKIAMNSFIKRPIWGYGINYDIVQTTLSYGNAQNGLLKLLLDTGIVGACVFVFVIYKIFINIKNTTNTGQLSCIAFIYAMLICSLVEINLSSIFMLGCALANMDDLKCNKCA